MSGSVVMRAGSDRSCSMKAAPSTWWKKAKKLGAGVLNQDGTAYIPLKAAMTALGGKAEDDGKGAWNVTCGESTATVDADDGKTKVDGKRASGNGFSTYTDQDKNCFTFLRRCLRRSLARRIPISVTAYSRSPV